VNSHIKILATIFIVSYREEKGRKGKTQQEKREDKRREGKKP
jgi:hypothetical protein